ncbi:MAG: hypothetical protein AAF945_03340 [Actinomycetota bacterium]
MNLVIFGVGVLVFLITVYGTVVSGGLVLTVRQQDDQPELLENADLPDGADPSDLSLTDRLTTY